MTCRMDAARPVIGARIRWLPTLPKGQFLPRSLGGVPGYFQSRQKYCQYLISEES